MPFATTPAETFATEQKLKLFFRNPTGALPKRLSESLTPEDERDISVIVAFPGNRQ